MTKMRRKKTYKGGALKLGGHVHILIFRLFHSSISWLNIFFFMLLYCLHDRRSFSRYIKFWFLLELQKFSNYRQIITFGVKHLFERVAHLLSLDECLGLR